MWSRWVGRGRDRLILVPRRKGAGKQKKQLGLTCCYFVGKNTANKTSGTILVVVFFTGPVPWETKFPTLSAGGRGLLTPSGSRIEAQDSGWISQVSTLYLQKIRARYPCFNILIQNPSLILRFVGAHSVQYSGSSFRIHLPWRPPCVLSGVSMCIINTCVYLYIHISVYLSGSIYLSMYIDR